MCVRERERWREAGREVQRESGRVGGARERKGQGTAKDKGETALAGS